MENKPNWENIECTCVFSVGVYFIELFTPYSIRKGNMLYEYMYNSYDKI
jgi:hypothetical protein